MNDRKKLGMDFADPQNRSEWRGRLREQLVQQAQPSVEENRAIKLMMMMVMKMMMMMMMMMMICCLLFEY